MFIHRLYIVVFMVLLLSYVANAKRKDERRASDTGSDNENRENEHLENNEEQESVDGDEQGSLGGGELNNEERGSGSRGRGRNNSHRQMNRGHGHDHSNRDQNSNHDQLQRQRSGSGIGKVLREGHESVLQLQELGNEVLSGVIKGLTDTVKKLDPKGTLKYIGKKVGKQPRFKNPKTYLWKGKKVTIPGITADLPVTEIKIANFSRLPSFGKSCKTRSAPNITLSPTDINQGPAADGLLPIHFKPCQERKRGSKKNKRLRDNAQKTTGHRQKRSETYSSISWLWSDPENIPIMFDSSYPESFRASGRQAWKYWENYTCLRFVEKATGTAMTEPHILLTSTFSGSCSTDRLGPAKFPPYSTKIDVNQCINLTGSVAHEIGHALGLSHSQKRTDRDKSVTVNLNNIAPSWQSQFEKDSDKQFDEWGVPYYYDSIMHYFPYAATANGLMTICPLDPIMEALMGQREEPAFGDISIINRIYCQESCFNKTEMKMLNFNGSLSMTISGRNCQNWATQTPHKHKYTSVGNHDYCRNPDNWSGGPWCYTSDPIVPYEPCFAACEDLSQANRPHCHGWCYNGGYHHPETCGCVCPRYASGEFCQNIDMTIKHAHVPCGGELSLKKGFPVGLSTPNWPHNYTADNFCIWWIKAPEKMKVRANVTDFLMEIPDESGCYDYVEIRKSICAAAKENPENMRFCGNSLAPNSTTGVVKTIISEDENLVLKFITDDHENARGFSMILEVV